MPQKLAAAKHPSSLLVDDTHAYYVSEDQLWAVPRGAGTPRSLAENIDAVSVMSKDALFACREAKNLARTIVRVPKAGGPTTEMATASKCSFGTHDGQLYFIEREDWGKEWLSRVPVAGGPVERVHRFEFTPDRLAVGDRYVYFDPPRKLARFDLTTEAVEMVGGYFSALHFDVFGPHLYWIESDQLERRLHTGGPTEVVGNFIDAMEFSAGASSMAWGQDEVWTRFDPATLTVRRFTAEHDVGPTVADGTSVYWLSRGKTGGVHSLETCGCNDETLPQSAAVRAIRPTPLEDRRIYNWAFASKGTLQVPVDDLSDDEFTVLWRAVHDHSGRVPRGTSNIPPRAETTEEFWAATTDGVSTARLVGFWVTSSDEDGPELDLMLEAPEIQKQSALVMPATEPKPSRLTKPKPSATAAATYLPGVQAHLHHAGIEVELKASNLKVYPTRFPAPHAAIIVVERKKPARSALLLGDATGSITKELEPLRGDEHWLRALVDLEGDGVMEFVYDTEAEDEEWSETTLITWEGSTPLREPLP